MLPDVMAGVDHLIGKSLVDPVSAEKRSVWLVVDRSVCDVVYHRRLVVLLSSFNSKLTALRCRSDWASAAIQLAAC
jgi:hypothetical protein